ncbi:hypothetical protein QFC19_001991 [Naganishia cerealis]|uniref:Uncharacterized protein n=1 Tax=Naganishia cerealis TaxID=610337 RepID=A0ACC2WED2_9TREE|nr:hypothetical protein QFC19_001991 [Naganishia cerealis]
MVRPKEIPNASFTYQKIFGEDEFFAAGILRIEVGGCNQYGFSNVCQKEVQLCFSQARRIKAEEDLPPDETLNNNQTTNAMVNNKTRYENGDGAGSARREEQDDDEDDDDSPPPIQKKRPVAKKNAKR